VAESLAEFWANRIGASKIENRSRNPISIPTSHSSDLRPLREPRVGQSGRGPSKSIHFRLTEWPL